MIRATAEQTVRCTPEEFLDLVMDPERYAQIDAKLGRIDWVRREENVTEFRFRSCRACWTWRAGSASPIC